MLNVWDIQEMAKKAKDKKDDKEKKEKKEEKSIEDKRSLLRSTSKVRDFKDASPPLSYCFPILYCVSRIELF